MKKITKIYTVNLAATNSKGQRYVDSVDAYLGHFLTREEAEKVKEEAPFDGDKRLDGVDTYIGTITLEGNMTLESATGYWMVNGVDENGYQSIAKFELTDGNEFKLVAVESL